MASLNEIKNRIGSVKSTLKITSAMKMVASSKLRRAQSAIEGMLPYQASLREILSELQRTVSLSNEFTVQRPLTRVAIVCMASNSSLCGGFNANVIRELRSRVAELRSEGVAVTLYPVGRKMAEGCKGIAGADVVARDLSELSGKPQYQDAARLASELVELFVGGAVDEVELVYNHFVSSASQKVVTETFLPLTQLDAGSAEDEAEDFETYIVEPDRQELVSTLLPKTLKLKLFTVLLDSSAAEHAARTVAMQTASDNAENILQDLSLEYNKSRQQKITAEILDIVGGSSC